MSSPGYSQASPEKNSPIFTAVAQGDTSGSSPRAPVLVSKLLALLALLDLP